MIKKEGEYLYLSINHKYPLVPNLRLSSRSHAPVWNALAVFCRTGFAIPSGMFSWRGYLNISDGGCKPRPAKFSSEKPDGICIRVRAF